MRKRTCSQTRWLLAGALAVAMLAAPQIATSAQPDNRGALLSDAKSASEYWDIVADFDNGYSLFARFQITNEGPGKRTAFATWYLVDPEKNLHPFHNGRRKGKWSLSSDRRSIQIGSSLFDQSGAMHRLEYESSKRKTHINIQFAPQEPAAWGGPQVSGNYSLALLDLGTPVTGTLQLKGMSEPVSVSGTISVTHVWMEKSEATLALRRIEFSSSGDGTAIYVSDTTTPSGDHHRWLVVERDGAELFRTTDFQLQLGDSTTKSAKDGYPTPKWLQVRAQEFEGTIQADTLLVAVDPLEVIPQPFRFLLSLTTRPHRVWMRSSFELRLRTGTEQKETVLRGSGVTTITFLNPLPSTVTRSETGNPGA